MTRRIAGCSPYPIGSVVTVTPFSVEFGAPAEMVGIAYEITKILATVVEIVPVGGGQSIRITPIVLERHKP
jgi:hypothetical protein